MMQIIHQLEDIPSGLIRPVVTLGNFDGVHRGHQQVLARLREVTEARGGTSVVITFRPHPIKILHPERAPSLICTYDEKLALIGQSGVDWVVEIPFDRDFSEWSAERFIEELLVNRIGAAFVLAGPDCHFGKNRRGDARMLSEHGNANGFDVETLEPHVDGDQVVSSSRIRQLLTTPGDVQSAAALLGRPFSLRGVVVKGDQRGRQIGVPTANLRLATELVPAHGVYAAWATVRNNEPNRAAVNIGIRPTFGKDQLSVEAHLLDFDDDVYGESMQLDLIDRVREEVRFDGIDALVAQIHADVQWVRERLR
jgi:riboflavin kinase/FMN adenylyltransferase